jgi:hypothetical protein
MHLPALDEHYPRGNPSHPTSSRSKRIFAPLLATVARQVNAQEVQNNILHSQVEHMIEKSGKAKNRAKHLHESTIKMLLFASAISNETVPTDLTDSCKRVINSKMVALAEQEINPQFKSPGLNMVSFPTGYTLNMYNGVLLWSSMDTPSNHSAFMFREAEPIRMEEQMNRRLTLQLILTQGKGMTVNEIKAANKQEVHAPMTFTDMTMQLQMFTIANDIFLGEISIGSQCLHSLQTMIDRSRSIFWTREILDKQFYSKFLFAINSHFQIWLKQCRNARNRNKVDYNTIDFTPVVLQVLFDSFHYNLPPTFQMKDPAVAAAATAKSASDKKENNGNEDSRQKKKKKDED